MIDSNRCFIYTSYAQFVSIVIACAHVVLTRLK